METMLAMQGGDGGEMEGGEDEEIGEGDSSMSELMESGVGGEDEELEDGEGAHHHRLPVDLDKFTGVGIRVWKGREGMKTTKADISGQVFAGWSQRNK
ncbi:MAG: hypothetical protein GY820_43925, partial [Gammaproteobacteria bacterium]|nr:hypothetical protein [Gammaproteobacteria bacterium]